MADIKPFRAVTYNQEKIRDYSRVACPPYDVISPKEQDDYHDLSPHNFIRIILGKDIPGEDKYRRAAACFREWVKDKILIRDLEPAIYFYSQEYRARGEKKARLGFIALMRLDDKNAAVFGHENTHLGPKQDRLKLIKQVKANLSPIFAVVEDKKRVIQRTFARHLQPKKPFIELTDPAGVTHKLWRLDSPEVLREVVAALAKENVFIADGHHRYEVACIYRELRKKRLKGSFTGEESFNYILTYFTDSACRGLTILPIHRLLRLEAGFSFGKFLESLRSYFTVEEVKDKTRFFFALEAGGRNEHLLGMYKDKKFWLLRLKNIRILDKIMPDKPKALRSLDVSVLNAIVFKNILGLDTLNKEILTFSPNAEELIRKVDAETDCVAFFLNPVKMDQIIEAALAGEKMPQKSTYFYPKVLSGLVINKFE
jgi:uncharacterized protein (DUF1015 family)